MRAPLLIPATLLLAGLAAGQTPTALASNYDAGSVLNQSSTPGTIAMPASTSAYTSTRVRGHYFTAPVPFAVTGLKVPDVNSLGFQTVALYRIEAGPPAYSSTIEVTPVFFQRWIPAGNFIPVVPPVVFNQGDVYVALGACSANNSTTLTSAYGPAQPVLTIGGQQVTAYRCGMQVSIAAASGPGANGIGPLWSENTGSIGETEAQIAVFQTPFPRLGTSVKPVLGTAAQLDLTANIPGATFGLVVLGVGRATTPTPLGTVLVAFPWFIALPVAGGTGPIAVPVPNDLTLAGAMLNWQGFAASPGNFGTSNGVEWRLGI